MIGYQPTPVENPDVVFEALTQDASNRMTICEQLRFIYDDVHKLPLSEEKVAIVEKLIVAFNMGKKMNSRLAHYKRLHTDSGRTGKNLLKLKHTEQRREMRQAR